MLLVYGKLHGRCRGKKYDEVMLQVSTFSKITIGASELVINILRYGSVIVTWLVAVVTALKYN